VVSACCSSCHCKCDLWPDTFHFISVQCRLPKPPRGSDTRDLLFIAVGKITLACRHRRLRSRQHATGNITTHTSPAASYALVRLRPPSYGRSPPESWPFMPALGILWLSTTNLFFNNFDVILFLLTTFGVGFSWPSVRPIFVLILTHVVCGNTWHLWTTHALNRVETLICVSLSLYFRVLESWIIATREGPMLLWGSQIRLKFF